MAIKSMQLDPNAITTNPAEGEYKVVAIHRQADGKLDIEYDDVAVSTKWPGLGMLGRYSWTDDYLATWITNGFIDLRMDITDYQDTAALALSKAAVIEAVAVGARVIWGVSSNSSNNALYTITEANWEAFRTAIKDAAQWAQDNGVYEFQCGNEEERHQWLAGAPGSIVRVSNVCTVTTPVAYSFTADDDVTIANVEPSNMGGTFTITVIDATHFSYTANGDDESNTTYTAEIYDISRAQMIAKIQAIATEVQAIFTNGNVSISITGWWSNIDANCWCTLGRGDFDFIGVNTYKETIAGTGYQDEIDDCIAAFGADHTYITEFNVNSVAINNYSADEAVQAAGVTEMINYIKASGIDRAIWFQWKGDAFGALKDNESYRQLWDSLLNSG